MKPKKPSKMIDRLLTQELGLGFSEGYYQGFLPRSPATVVLHFGRHDLGWLVHFGVCYPVGQGGFQMNPLEASVLDPEGSLLWTPDESERNRFWGVNDFDKLIPHLRSNLLKWIEILLNASLMSDLYRYLLGESESIPVEFEQIKNDWVQRGHTANRLLGLSGYLALAGDYQAALDALSMIKPNFVGTNERKVISDCQRRQIEVPAEGVNYMLSIGAKQIP